MQNNGSHFGEDEQVYYFYWILMGLSLILYLIVRAKYNKSNSKNEETDFAAFYLSVGILLLTIGFILKVVHLQFYSNNGKGIPALDTLSVMLKSLSEATVMTILIAIGWGWTINYYKCYYL